MMSGEEGPRTATKRMGVEGKLVMGRRREALWWGGSRLKQDLVWQEVMY